MSENIFKDQNDDDPVEEYTGSGCLIVYLVVMAILGAIGIFLAFILF